MVLFELAEKLGIEVVEDDFTAFDMYAAEEAFISGTSGSIAPVRSLNGSRNWRRSAGGHNVETNAGME